MFNILLRLDRKKRVILYSSIWVLVIIICYLLLLQPKTTQLKMKEVELENKKNIYQRKCEEQAKIDQELKILTERQRLLQNKREELLRKRKVEMELAKIKLGAKDVITFFNEFAQTAEDNNAKLIYVKPLGNGTPEADNIISIYEVKLIGRYQAFINIFTDLDYHGLLTELQHFNIKIADDYPNLQLVLKIKLLRI